MSHKLAKLQEHSDVKLPDLGGNGTLPAYCTACDDKLDFVRKNDKTFLICRSCGKTIPLD